MRRNLRIPSEWVREYVWAKRPPRRSWREHLQCQIYYLLMRKAPRSFCKMLHKRVPSFREWWGPM